MKKENLEILNRAITEGIKIRITCWEEGSFCCFKDGAWFYMGDDPLSEMNLRRLFSNDLEILNEKKTWYRYTILDMTPDGRLTKLEQYITKFSREELSHFGWGKIVTTEKLETVEDSVEKILELLDKKEGVCIEYSKSV